MVAGDAPTDFWRLGESSGSAIADWVGSFAGSAKAGVALGTTGSLLGDPNTAATFNGTSTGFVSTGAARAGLNTFTGTAGPNGMELYVDGALVANRLDAKGGRSYSGN